MNEEIIVNEEVEEGECGLVVGGGNFLREEKRDI
jgi:uridylate kinase